MHVVLPINEVGDGIRPAIFKRTTFTERPALTHAPQMMSSIERFATTRRALEDPERGLRWLRRIVNLFQGISG